MRGLMAGVFDVMFLDQSTGALVSQSKTLINSGLSMSISSEEARAGNGNVLLGKYYHSSTFGLTMEDQLWDLNYLAMNCGGSITANADVMRSEEVTITEANKITVKEGTPVEFTSDIGVIGWYRLSTESGADTKVCTFDGQDAAVDGLNVGDVVCVRYMVQSTSARQFIVNSNYTPSIYHVVLKGYIYKSGSSGETVSGQSKIGEITIDIPNFQLEGTQDFSLSASGFSSMSLSGTALSTDDGAGGCGSGGYYAIIKEEEYGLGEFDKVSAIVVANSDIALATGETSKLVVYKMYNDGTQPSPVLDNSVLTIVSKDTSVETVTTEGVITAVGNGESVIEILVTEKPALEARAVVTVE